MSIFAIKVPRPNVMAASIAASTDMYFRVYFFMGIPSFLLRPGGFERCIMSRHLLDSFFGTTPREFIWSSENGGVSKGPAV